MKYLRFGILILFCSVFIYGNSQTKEVYIYQVGDFDVELEELLDTSYLFLSDKVLCEYVILDKDGDLYLCLYDLLEGSKKKNTEGFYRATSYSTTVIDTVYNPSDPALYDLVKSKLFLPEKFGIWHFWDNEGNIIYRKYW